MKEEPDDPESTLSETMVARIEIEELGDPGRQKQITDAVEALDGVIEVKIEKDALHVSYDPLATTEKKIEEAIRSTGSSVKGAATDTETARPHLPTPANAGQAPAAKVQHGEHP
jgi:copper chaperone CopZ